MSPIIYWFRNDLRLHDNKAFNAAIETGKPIVALYIFEEEWITGKHLGFERTGPQRLTFREASVDALRSQLDALGGNLLVLRGSTAPLLIDLYNRLKADAIYAHHEFASEEIDIENQLAAATTLKLFWGNMLFPPDSIPLPQQAAPFYYTTFKNKVTSLKNKFTETPEIKEITFYQGASSLNINHIYHPSPIGINGFAAGETNALKALERFVSAKHLDTYIQTRELFEGDGFSTLLSPYLAIGALSPQRIFNVLGDGTSSGPTNEASVTKLKEQLIWRDYYRWLFLRYKTRIFRRTGLRNQTPPMYNDRDAFENWRDGETSQPLINALMKELRQTGFMSNRGRMLTAYYLSKEMKVNWLWGAKWFESQLIDFDVCNNYGNWAYQSGTGTDSRINRKFNIAKQSQKFDPSGHYQAKWNKNTALQSDGHQATP